MPMVIPFIPAIIAAGAAVGSSAIAANASKNEAKKEANAQRDAQLAQPQQVTKAETGGAATSADANIAAKNKQAQQAKSATGRRQTILTGPLGEVGDSGSGGTKTLLGL